MRRPLFALSALVFSACASSDGPVAPPVSTFFTQVAAAEATLVVCQRGLAPTAAAAVCGLSESDKLALVQADADYRNGKIRFVLAKAQSCLAALAPPAVCWGAASTEQALLLSEPADCAAAIEGTVPVASACESDLECADGVCNKSSCPGTCVSGAAAGETCAANTDCAQGLICNVNLCAVAGAAGTDCKTSNDCSPGLACITTILRGNGSPLTPDGTCSTPLAAGAACDPQYSNPCSAGFWCAPAGGSTGTGTCSAQLAAGASCTVGHGATSYTEPLESAQCLGHQICAGLVVDGMGNVTSAGRCAVPHDLGGSCSVTGVAATQGCYLGLICDSTGTCVAPAEIGAPCSTPPSDNSGLTVDYCAPGAYCDSPSNGGLCQAKLADGMSGCSGNSSCVSGSCDTSTFTCAGPAGSVCSAPL